MTSFSLTSLSIVENFRPARLLCGFFVAVCISQAGANESLQWVETQVLSEWQKLGGKVADSEVSFPTLSVNYQFAPCDHEPMIQFVRHLQPGRNGVEIKCERPFWRQSLAVQLATYDDVVTVGSDVLRDRVITAEQLRLTRMDTAGLHLGYFHSIDDVAGKLSKRSLRQGTPIVPDMLAMPDLVERGQPVTVRLDRPGLSIEIEGEALSDGHLGERIRVKNSRSGKTLFAEVIASGLVQVQ